MRHILCYIKIMRILHTSDWHLGKIFHDRPLVEDQKCFLDQIIAQFKKAEEENDSYSALVVPGDIYDRSVPSADATRLFSEFLYSVNEQFPDLHQFYISGNHDSAARLAFADSFLGKHNIHITTDTKAMTVPVIVANNGEKAAFYQLPFLVPLSVPSEDEDKVNRTQQELYSAACKKIMDFHIAQYPDALPVIAAHLFTSGSSVSASERSNIGTAEQVDVAVFDGFAYGALGHIHKVQPCNKGKTVWYSGAPLAYNFDDSPETFMLDVRLEQGKAPSVSKVPFVPLHKVVRLEGKLREFSGPEADLEKFKVHKDDFVQVILTDEVMPSGSYDLLVKVFPNLLLVSPKERASGGNSGSLQQRKEAIRSNQPDRIFAQFLMDAYGKSASSQSEGSGKGDLVQKENKLFLKEALESGWGE